MSLSDSTDDAGVRTVCVLGEDDVSSVARVTSFCSRGAHRSIDVDLSSVTFMDAAGDGALVESRRVVGQTRGTLTRLRAAGQPAKLLDLLDRMHLADHSLSPPAPDV